jgi:hypothetical protein
MGERRDHWRHGSDHASENLIVRDQMATRFVLTEQGRAVLAALLAGR